MFFKFVFFLSLQVLAVFGLGGNVVINLPELDEEQLKWPQQKIQTIEYLLDTLIEVGNVTLIGWQNVWNSDGTLKEIRTIELTLLNHTVLGENLDLTDDDMIAELPVVLDAMKQLTSATGILVSGSVQEWDRYDKLLVGLEIDQSSIMVNFIETDLLYWQQNITVPNLVPVQNLIKVLQQESRLPVGVLNWNVDGTINLQSSVVVPELLASVKSVVPENVSLPVLESALMGLSKAVLLQTDEMSLDIANYMKQNIPGYTWIVAKDLTSLWVKPSVFLNVEYEWVNIGELPISMDIMGIPIQAS